MSAILQFGYDDSQVRAGLSGLTNRLRSAKLTADQQLTLEARVSNSSLSGLTSSLGSALNSPAITGLTTFIGGALTVGALKGVVDEFDRLGDLASRLGVTAESIQRVGRQAKLSGSDVETVVASLTKLRRNIESGGDDKVSSALASIGLNAAELLSLEPDQQIIRLADAFQTAQASGTGFAALQDLLGKGFVQLLPLLRTSREELRKLAGEPVVSEKNIQQIQDFNDRLDNAVANVKVGLVEGVDGVVTQLLLMGTALTEGLESANTLGQQLAQGERDQLETKKKKLQADRDAAALQAEKDEAAERAAKASEINADTEKKKAAIAYDALTTAEKLEAVYDRIAGVNVAADALRGRDDPVAAAKLQSELVDLFKEELSLKERLQQEQDKEGQNAQNAANAQKRRDETRLSISERIAILDAEAEGNEKLAKQLRDQADLRQRIAGLTAQGLSPEEATDLAQQEQQAENAAEQSRKRDEGSATAGRRKIKGGVSDASVREKIDKMGSIDEGFKFPGLDAFEANQPKNGGKSLLGPQGPLRDTFKFPGLDAFKANQPANGAKSLLRSKNADNNTDQRSSASTVSLAEGSQIIALLTSLDTKLTFV